MSTLCMHCKEKAKKAGMKGLTIYDLCPDCKKLYDPGIKKKER